MPASFRTQLVDLFTHSASGSKGRTGSSYARVASPFVGTKWPASKESASARERGIAAQLQHELDTTFGFGPEATAALTPDGLIRHGAEWYSIDSILPANRLREITVNAVLVSDEPAPSAVGVVSDLASLVLTPSAATIAVLGTRQFTVQGYDSTGLPVSLEVLPPGWIFFWTKAGPGQAAIDVSATGLVTGVSETTDDAFVNAVVNRGFGPIIEDLALVTVTP